MQAPSLPSRRFLVAGNWKMHGSRALTVELLGALGDALRQPSWRQDQAPEILVCPPFVYLQQAAALVADSGIRLGGQNVATHAEGAFTGEVSAAMLLDAGCSYVLVGHSERRALYGESDELVAARLAAASAAGLTPLLCVGETLDEREGRRTEEVIGRQLGALAALPQGAPPPVIAYEPVWAIGTGRTAAPEQAREVHAFIRAQAAEAGLDGAQLRIVYGGSVKPDNAAGLFAQPGVDGALVGGASLKAQDFLTICKAVVRRDVD